MIMPIYLQFIILILASAGIINVLLFSPIFDWYRDLIVKIFDKFGKRKNGEYLIGCPVCTGFWVGVVMTALFATGYIWLSIPFAVSFVGYLCQVYWFPVD